MTGREDKADEESRRRKAKKESVKEKDGPRRHDGQKVIEARCTNEGYPASSPAVWCKRALTFPWMVRVNQYSLALMSIKGVRWKLSKRLVSSGSPIQN